MNEQVRIDGNIVEIDGRWKMELPGGVRARYEETEDDAKFSLYIDRREIASCELGRTEEDRQASAILYMASASLLSTVYGREMNALLETDVRNDERMHVRLTLKMDTEGQFLFELRVEEKTRCEIYILFEPPCTLDDAQSVLQKLQDNNSGKVYGIEHPFGYEWEQYWWMAVRIAASVAPIDEPSKPIEFGPTIAMDGGISFQLPAELASIEVADGETTYLPADRTLTQEDLDHLNQFSYYVTRKIMKIEATEPEQRQLVFQSLCKTLAYQNSSTLAVPLCESMSSEGYKATYLLLSKGVIVFATSAEGAFAYWSVISAADKDLVELIQIARGIYDRIKFENSSGEMIPFSYPRVPDAYHEHFTLVSSHSYTTRRDADFVGQPIRALMKEAGYNYEDAYGIMAIPNDSYSLDAEARELAKVFRLDASLFDPYSDTEAMIRIGMFSDVRMFHALRSLAWTVSCKVEREGRQLSDYRFEELKEIGEYIERKEYLNYATESYCSGLCSHHDWRVFYVPDAYIGSDCERSTDLRNLCGKENRSGNVSFVSIPSLGIGNPRDMHNLNRLINRNEEALESLEALREDLQKLLPIMKAIHDGFMVDRNRAEKLEGPLADALTAWCALAVAAKEPFYSEEASNQPETNAGLKEPLERPDDTLADVGSARRTSGERAKAPASKAAAPKPFGDVLDLGGATTIAPNQFAGNMTLRNVVIPEGVTEIGQGAFNSCMFLETVSFPKSLKKIGNFAFMSCRNLKRVEFSEGIEELGDHAFGATSSLKEVHLPDSLKKVAYNVFGIGGDSPYATAYISGELARRLYDNGEKYFRGINARHLVIDGKPYESVEEYVSSAGTSSRGYAPTHSVEATPIGHRPGEYRMDMEAACRAGKSLQQMIDAARQAIAQNEYADHDAFESAVQNLDRDAVITFAGKHFALSGFGGNEQEVIAEIEKRGGIVHSSMVKKADYLVVCLDGPGAAKVNKALEWREKGAKNQIVSDYQLWQAMLGAAPVGSSTAAQGTTDASKATAPTEQSKPSQTQQQTRSTQQKTVPSAGTLSQYNDDREDLVLPDGIKSVSKSAFAHNLLIRSVVIPEGVVTIEEEAFRDCYLLQKISLPSTLRSIGSSAFSECRALKSLVIPEGVEEIPDSAFDFCVQLRHISLPGTLRRIGNYAFSCCYHLSGVVIPNGVIEIERDAFSLCRNLQTVILPDTLQTIGDFSFGSCDALKDIYVPSAVETISSYAFGFGWEGKTFTIHTPRGSAMEAYALEHKLKVDDQPVSASVLEATSTMKEAIPEAVHEAAVETTLDDFDFDSTGRLDFYKGSARSIILPKELKRIDSCGGYERLISIIIPEGAEELCDNAFDEHIDLESVSLPSTLKKIGSYAFVNCHHLRELMIPEGVEVIDRSTFSGCHNLRSIRLPGSLKVIGEGAFEDCAELTDILIPDGVQEIGSKAFKNCARLCNASIPGNVKRIEKELFSGCKSLTNISIPEGVEEICERAFENCERLCNASIPGNVKRIEKKLFSGCKSLTNISIPEGVEEICERAFENCECLKSVALPNTLKAIRGYAFYRCWELKDIYVPASVTEIEQSAFDEVYSLVVHTTQGSAMEAYAKEIASWELKTNENQLARGRGMAEQEAREREARRKQEVEEQAEREREAEERAQKERERQEQARWEREEAERRRIEAQKAAERVRIQKEISDLAREMASLTGLFAGIKRRKLQRRIDELNAQLQRL